MSEYSFEELALESVELLPDRDTLQVTSIAYNTASITQSASSSADGNTVVGGSVSSTGYNVAAVYQTAASSADGNTVVSSTP